MLTVMLCLTAGFTLTTATNAADNQTSPQEQQAQQPPQSPDEALGTMSRPSPLDPNKVIVARVNGVGITTQSVTSMTNRLVANRPEAESPPNIAEIRKQALNRLILQELALQEAHAKGVKIEEEKIDSVVAAAKDKLGGEEGYRAFLEKEGMTEQDLRMQIERNLTLEKIFTQEVQDKITVSEDRVKETYEKEKARYHMPEKVSIIDVVLFLDPQDKDSLTKADEILKKVKDAKDADPRNLTLDGTFVVRELDVKKDKDEALYAEARKLQVGELSGVIKTPDSLDIIKLTHYSPEKQFTLEEARGFIEAQLRAQSRQKRSLEWEAELKKGATIEILDLPEESGH